MLAQDNVGADSMKKVTPCGTRARNLRIRGPTPCPLGQGGMCLLAGNAFLSSTCAPGEGGPAARGRGAGWTGGKGSTSRGARRGR